MLMAVQASLPSYFATKRKNVKNVLVHGWLIEKNDGLTCKFASNCHEEHAAGSIGRPIDQSLSVL